MNTLCRAVLTLALLGASVGASAQVVGKGTVLDHSLWAGAARTYASGNFYLELGGVGCGFVNSLEGGGVTADVIPEPPVGFYRKKHIAQATCQPLKIQVSPGMGGPLMEWVGAFLRGQGAPKDVAIVACDHRLQAQKRTHYAGCRITEIRFPACNGVSKDAAYLGLVLQPETAREAAAQGQMSAGTGNEQRTWLPANFQFQVGGIDTTRVNKVGEIVVRAQVTEREFMRGRVGVAAPAQPAGATAMVTAGGVLEIEFGDISVTTAETASETWAAWHQSFVVEGRSDDAQEKSGTLKLLSPNRQQVLLTLAFQNLGICGLAADKVEANAEQIRRLTATLYCERIEMEVGGAAPRDDAP